MRITDIRTGATVEIALSLDARDMAGWNEIVTGWSIGPVGSGAPIELDEPLEGCRIGIFGVSNHVLLWGTAPSLPRVWMLRAGEPIPIEAGNWTEIDRDHLREMAQVGDVRLRFDRRPIRIGDHVIEM